MTFLPIVERELRVASRWRSTYWVRMGAALAVIVAGTWLFLMMRHEPTAETAKVLFGTMTGCAILYCLLSGVRSTADCLSIEKREGTLGLLFLTDLRGYDVVLGKLAATSLNGLYCVLAIVPVLAMPLMMGGVTGGEFGRMALVALNTLFYSLAIGMCVSALCRSARKAMGTTFLLLLIPTALWPACGAWLAYLGQVRMGDPLFLMLSPARAFYLAWDIFYRSRSFEFWQVLGAMHAAAWVCLALACFIAPRSWQERPAGIKRLRWRELWRQWSYGDPNDRRVYRHRLLRANAFYWLVARDRWKPALVWGVFGLLACVWAWGMAKFQHDWFDAPTYVTTGLVLNALVKGWIASETGRQLAEDRKSGALELLLSTPLSSRHVLAGQRLALQRQFLGPLLLVLLAFFAMMMAYARANPRDLASWYAFWIAVMVMLVADVFALYWVGMWRSLVAKNPHRASSGSILRILVIPWLAYAGVMLLVGLAATQGAPGPGWKFFLGLWVFLGLAADAGFGGWARFKFLTEFRRAAEQRYAPPVSLWKRLTQ